MLSSPHARRLSRLLDRGAWPRGDPPRDVAAAGARRRRGARPAQRRQPRHRSAGVPRPGAARTNTSACARRFRPATFRRRSSTAMPASASSSTARPTSSAARCSRSIPHQTRYVVPAAAVHLLPDDVPARRAVLAANLETAVNAVWDAGARAGRPGGGDRRRRGRVLVAWLAARIPGCEVELVDVRADARRRRDRARRRFARLRPASRGPDVVFHASGVRRRPGHGAPARRCREHGRGTELVRRPRRAGAARRSVPFAAPGAQGVAGRRRSPPAQRPRWTHTAAAARWRCRC